MRIYRIRHQRHDGEIAILPAEVLEGLLRENALLRDKAVLAQIKESRKAPVAGRLVEYAPRR